MFHYNGSNGGLTMEMFLGERIDVPLECLYPDPNNPRLGLADTPGYDDPDALFADEVRDRIFGDLGNNAYGVDELVETIIGQGWMPIDSIVVWKHPKEKKRFVVVEGNRRRLALEKIRADELPKARRKLERVESNASAYSQQTVREEKERVTRLERIVKDTAKLSVVPIAAKNSEELRRKLPRLLAVRHIARAKEWGNYAEDLWLLRRYSYLYEEKYGAQTDLAWDDALIHRVAEEASVGPKKAKWQLRASAWYSHFRAEWSDELPEDNEFAPSDYYLFENIARLPWVRGRLGIDDSATHISPESERVLFDWVFRLKRTGRADENPNVFYRHENVKLWDQMRRYDDKEGTNFSNRFDPENHSEAPRMHEVEAEWLSHKARRKPADILSELLRRLKELSAEALATEGEFLRKQLEELVKVSTRYVKMIEAAEVEE